MPFAQTVFPTEAELAKLYAIDAKDGVVRMFFDNANQLWDTVWPAEGQDAVKRDLDHMLAEGAKMHWDGMRGTSEELYNVVTQGWDDGIGKGEKLTSHIEALKLPSAKRKVRKAECGHRLDIHRVYAGRLDQAWDRMGRSDDFKSSMKKVSTTIMVRVGENCDTSSEALFWRGAVASTICQALEESGRPVRVVSYAVIENLGPTWNTWEETGKYGRVPGRLAIAITIKDFRDPLELNKMYSMTALSGFWRKFIFKAMHCIPYYKANGGLGRSCTRRESDFKNLQIDEGADVVVDVSQVSCEADAIAELAKFRNNVENPENWKD